MSSDLQMNVSTRLGPVLGDQKAMEGGMRGITTATKAANREMNELQQNGSKHFKSLGHEADGLKGKIKELGEALHKGGGRGSELGEAGHGLGRLAALGGMGAGFLGVGLLAAAGTEAIQIYDNVKEKHIEAVKEQIEWEEKLKDAMKEAHEQDVADGKHGLSFDKSQRPLAALGGQAAVRDATRFARTYSVPLEEAQNTVKASMSLPPNMRAIAQMAAGMFGHTGIGTSEEGMKGILDNGNLAQGTTISKAEMTAALKSPQAMNEFLGNAVKKAKLVASGLISDKTGTPYSPSAVDDATGNVDQDQLAQAADANTQQENTGDETDIKKAKLVAEATRKQNEEKANRERAALKGPLRLAEQAQAKAFQTMNEMDTGWDHLPDFWHFITGQETNADRLQAANRKYAKAKRAYDAAATPPYSPDNSFNQQNNVEH
jgi:hypothetical protein